MRRINAHRIVPAGTGAARRKSPAARILRAAIEFLVPVGLFYGLRAAGVSAYAALLAGTAISAAGSLADLLRSRKVSPFGLYALSLMVLSTVVSLVPGDERFLLARGAVVVGVSGLWFLISAATRKPLVYVMSRPILEGRFGWPGQWDSLWSLLPRFRRIWRATSILWGAGLCADAAVRVYMAWNLPVDAVPGLATALTTATTAGLIVLANIYYQASGAARAWSSFYAGIPRAADGYPKRHWAKSNSRKREA
ncbi:VC0807 family protein [Arthrobacter citreus]|uniref:VC0807 family protein n=1 Tax=Arthrobacter citreus TaxID=1670 RepID=UPI003815147A